MDDEREPQKKTFCGVDLFILIIYIFFHRFVSQITQKENRARTNLSHFFLREETTTTTRVFLLRGVDVDRGRRGEFSNEFRRRKKKKKK